MLLLCLLLAFITLGSSISLREDLCYGSTYYLPAYFAPGFYNKTITYLPKLGDPKIVVNHGQSLDSRFKVSRAKIEMNDISERDNEATITIVGTFFRNVILRVKNCRSIISKLCGSSIKWIIPYDGQYLEFSSSNALTPPVILWNRTSGAPMRGTVIGSDYEIKGLTQKDSGYYRFRGSRDQLLKWDQYVVEENVRSYSFDEGNIRLEYPLVFTPAKVRFKHEDGYVAQTLSESDGRFKITNQYLGIEYATPENSGTYSFLDKDGNLILVITLEVREVEKVWVSVVILAAISFGFIFCCCCMKKYCCKDSSDKTDGPEANNEAAATPVYNHGTQTTEPVTPLLTREPRVVFPAPPTYHEAGGHMDPPPPYEECNAQPLPTYSSQAAQTVPAEPPVTSSETTNPEDAANTATETQVSPPDQDSLRGGAAGATTFNIGNLDLADSEPRFQLSESILSAPPLSPDGSHSVQYHSDKLNLH